MRLQKEQGFHRKTGRNGSSSHKRLKQPGNIKRARRRQMLCALCYAALIGLCCFCLWRLEAGREPRQGQQDLPRQVILTDQEGNGELISAAGKIAMDSLYSPYAILVDAETGQVVAERNSGERMYPASMTKLMAALVAVERTEDWDAAITIPQEIFAKLYMEHASLAGFEPGEQVTPKDLLYGMLLPSGAECCTVYAAWLAGDEETFVEWMNEKADELGMENTHFVNTSGLHDDEHYSTVEDMAVLMRQCIQDDMLRQALSAERYQTTFTAIHPQGLTLENTLFQALAEIQPTYTKIIGRELSDEMLLGGKTGYTSQAGLCLASFANVGGREYILVTAGAAGNHYTEPFHLEDALAVYGQLAKSLKQ